MDDVFAQLTVQKAGQFTVMDDHQQTSTFGKLTTNIFATFIITNSFSTDQLMNLSNKYFIYCKKYKKYQ